MTDPVDAQARSDWRSRGMMQPFRNHPLGTGGSGTFARRWALDRLGRHHLDYQNGFPRYTGARLPQRRNLALVHATPWSIVEVVLPGVPDDVARRMLWEGETDVVAYGHIHSACGLPLSTRLRRLMHSGRRLHGPNT